MYYIVEFANHLEDNSIDLVFLVALFISPFTTNALKFGLNTEENAFIVVITSCRCFSFYTFGYFRVCLSVLCEIKGNRQRKISISLKKKWDSNCDTHEKNNHTFLECILLLIFKRSWFFSHSWRTVFWIQIMIKCYYHPDKERLIFMYCTFI